MTTVDHADICGLAPTLRVSVRCLPRSRNEDFTLVTPPRVPPHRDSVFADARWQTFGVAGAERLVLWTDAVTDTC